MGMQVLGLRLVRVGEKTRLVRAGDVAGARRWGVGRIYTCILTLAVLCGVGYYLYQVVWVNPGRDQQAAVQGVRNDSSEAVRVVSEAYCLAIAAAGPAEPQLNDLYVPSARGIAQELAGRHTAGRLQCYTILSVQLPDYKWPGPGEMGRPSGQVVAVIQVAESGSDSSLAGAYDYTLVRNVHVTRSGLTTSEWFGQWQIESVKVEGS
jgi:hypothetical protein